jgi:outer membrane protein with beta-barrel domain
MDPAPEGACVRRAIVLLLLLPASAWAQLVPGQGHVLPTFGTCVAGTDLLASTTPIQFDHTGQPPFNPVSTSIGLDPGLYLGLRYTYNLTRRLAVEGEASYSVSGFVIEMLELIPGATGEPQFETTTTDAHVYQLFADLAYHIGNWPVHPIVTLGIGWHDMDLRQKGELKTDPIKDVACRVGLGVLFRGNDRLGIRAEIRNVMYNFYFDNQFAGAGSDQIVSNRDVGLAVAAAGPRFQNDLAITVGFEVRVH